MNEDEYMASIPSEFMSPIDNSVGKSVRKAKDVVSIGERVEVHGHGSGVVRGIGCCGHGSNRVHVDYLDGTYHHCALDTIIGDHVIKTSGTGMPSKPLLSADMPEEIDDESEECECEDVILEPSEARKFRAVAARLNYLAYLVLNLTSYG